ARERLHTGLAGELSLVQATRASVVDRRLGGARCGYQGDRHRQGPADDRTSAHAGIVHARGVPGNSFGAWGLFWAVSPPTLWVPAPSGGGRPPTFRTTSRLSGGCHPHRIAAKGCPRTFWREPCSASRRELLHAATPRHADLLRHLQPDRGRGPRDRTPDRPGREDPP